MSMIRWVCDKCTTTVRTLAGTTEVVHRCKGGKANVPMRREAEDDER